MIRLDSLSQDELNKLYKRSAILSQLGTLVMIVVTICSVVFLFTFPWLLLLSIPMFAVSYVFKYVRTPLARIYFYVSSIFGIVSFGLAILDLAVIFIFAPQAGDSVGRFVIPGIICLLICIEVLKSAKTDALFGPDYLSHKQIVLARKKKRKNEYFSDEDFPKSSINPSFAKICVVIAFIWEALLILGVIDQLFLFIQPLLMKM